MRRRSVASPLISFALAVVLAPGTAYAVDPNEHGGLDHRASAGGARADRATREAASDVVIQTHPGANGKIAYSRAPYAAWPSGGWVMEARSDDSDLTMLTPGSIGDGRQKPSLVAGRHHDRLHARPDVIAPMTHGTTSTSMQANGTGLKRLTNTSGRRVRAELVTRRRRIASAQTAPAISRSTRCGSTARTSGALRTMRPTTGNPYWSPDGNADRLPLGPRRQLRDLHDERRRIGRDPAHDRTQGTDFSPYVVPGRGEDRIDLGSDRQLRRLHDERERIVSRQHHERARSRRRLPELVAGRQLIIFSADQFGDFDIFVTAATGGGPRTLTFEFDDEYNPDWQPIPAFPLVDARFSIFEVDIHWVFDQAITTGCSAERYCPDDPVTREQMASFLVRALDLPAADAGLVHRRRDARSTSPTSTASRRPASRRAAVARTTAPRPSCPGSRWPRSWPEPSTCPSSPTDFFTDDETSIHEPNINSIADDGIATGCAANKYCPTAVVTRGQMAAFLHRALD